MRKSLDIKMDFNFNLLMKASCLFDIGGDEALPGFEDFPLPDALAVFDFPLRNIDVLVSP